MKQKVPPNELNFEMLHQRTSAANIKEETFQYLNEHNSYQILFVFHNCKKINNEEVLQYFQNLFSKYQKLDLKIAMCNIKENSASILEFLDNESYRKDDVLMKKKQFIDFKELQKTIPNLSWSENCNRMKLVIYIAANYSNYDEIEVNMKSKNSVSDFLESKNIYEFWFQFGNYGHELLNCESFEEFTASKTFQNVLQKRKFKWLSEQLFLLKRLRIRTSEDLTAFKKDKLKCESIDLVKKKFIAEFKVPVKKSYLEEIPT